MITYLESLIRGPVDISLQLVLSQRESEAAKVHPPLTLRHPVATPQLNQMEVGTPSLSLTA